MVPHLPSHLQLSVHLCHAAQPGSTWTGSQGILAPRLYTDLCFHANGTKMLIVSMHTVFHRMQCLSLSRTRKKLVLFWPNIGNLYTLQLSKTFPLTDAYHLLLGTQLSHEPLFLRQHCSLQLLYAVHWCTDSSLWKSPFVYCAQRICIRK